MSSFKLDTHVHTSNVSPCGKVCGREMVRLYKEAGYDGIVITDHFFSRYFYSMENLNWGEKIKCFLSGYYEALEEGNRVGLNVLLGMEITFKDDVNDFLVYGIDEGFLMEHENLFEMDLIEFRRLIEGRGIIYQAHPFRPYMSAASPSLIDGVEVFNGNERHDSRNHLAYKYARDNGLRMISGSDAHRIEDVGRGGIVLDVAVRTGRELVGALMGDRVVELVRG